MMSMNDIEQWQMKRLLKEVEQARSISGFRVQGFYYLNERADVYEALIENGQIRVKDQLNREKALFYRDVWFILPHIVIEAELPVGELMLVFYADDFKQLTQWLQEKLPNARSITATERLLAGRVLVD